MRTDLLKFLWEYNSNTPASRHRLRACLQTPRQALDPAKARCTIIHCHREELNRLSDRRRLRIKRQAHRSTRAIFNIPVRIQLGRCRREPPYRIATTRRQRLLNLLPLNSISRPPHIRKVLPGRETRWQPVSSQCTVLGDFRTSQLAQCPPTQILYIGRTPRRQVVLRLTQQRRASSIHRVRPLRHYRPALRSRRVLDEQRAPAAFRAA